MEHLLHCILHQRLGRPQLMQDSPQLLRMSEREVWPSARRCSGRLRETVLPKVLQQQGTQRKLDALYCLRRLRRKITPQLAILLLGSALEIGQKACSGSTFLHTLAGLTNTGPPELQLLLVLQPLLSKLKKELLVLS